MPRKPPPPPLSAASLGPRSSSLNTPTPVSAASSTSSTRGPRRRPSPLNLTVQRDLVGQDEELSAQLMTDGLRSAITVVSEGEDDAQSDLSKDIDNLSLLRQDVSANLRERPLAPVSPMSLASSDAGAVEDKDECGSSSLPVRSLLEADPRRVILDTRPLAAYLTSHLPSSLHLTAPAPSLGRPYTWDALGVYISPRKIWDAAKARNDVQIIVVGSSDGNEDLEQLERILEDLVGKESVKVVSGGWEAVLADKAVSATLITTTTTNSTETAAPPISQPNAGTALFDTTQDPYPTLPQLHPVPTHKQSMPSLRTGIKRTNVPSLSIKTGTPALSTAAPGPSRAPPPRLALNLDTGDATDDVGGLQQRHRRPSRSNTTGQYPDLHLNIPPAAVPSGSGSGSASPALKSPTSRIGSLRSPIMSGSPTALAPQTAGHLATASTSSRGVASAPFIVSTIIPSFLYLGPEITSQAEIRALRSMGIKRILNVAIECEDDQALGLSKAFERYTKIPMRDIVEETGVGRHMREACDLLDDARLHSEPVYVHCKAGKSRSVTVVLAYLIHAHAWTLKTAYAYVGERRKGISPNIGFVAELMAFEEKELGTRKPPANPPPSRASKTTQINNDNTDKKDNGNSDNEKKQAGPRDSMPAPSRPQWISAPSSSLDTRPPRPLPPQQGHKQDGVGKNEGKGKGDEDEEEAKRRPTTRDEREVMKNGHWVQHRRAPTDRTTLQPGRRASKAGLESLRSPDPEIGGHQSSDR